MKLLKLIPVAALVFTAFLPFEAKAGYPSGWTEFKKCAYKENTMDIYLLENTDTPAAWGTYDDKWNEWRIENVSYDCASNWFKYNCGKKTNKPTCTS